MEAQQTPYSLGDGNINTVTSKASIKMFTYHADIFKIDTPAMLKTSYLLPYLLREPEAWDD